MVLAGDRTSLFPGMKHAGAIVSATRKHAKGTRALPVSRCSGTPRPSPLDHARIGLILSLLCSIFTCQAVAQEKTAESIVDLTHSFGEDTIYWPTSERFQLKVVSDGMTPKGYYYAANNFCTAEHGGTHMDAPVHFAKDHPAVDQVPVEKLVGEGIVVDVSQACAGDRDHLIAIADFLAWEKEHGQIKENTIVLLRTGFGKFWPDPVRYLGTAKRGKQGVVELHFPGLHPEAAKWLVEKRHIKAVGLDTASIDYGQSTLYESHRVLGAADTPIFENVANLETLPPSGFKVIALPMKIKKGSGAPLRIIAIY